MNPTRLAISNPVAEYVTHIRAPFDSIVTERLRSIGKRLNVADKVIRIVVRGAERLDSGMTVSVSSNQDNAAEPTAGN